LATSVGVTVARTSTAIAIASDSVISFLERTRGTRGWA